MVDDELKLATFREPPTHSVTALLSHSYRFAPGVDAVGVYMRVGLLVSFNKVNLAVSDCVWMPANPTCKLECTVVPARPCLVTFKRHYRPLARLPITLCSVDASDALLAHYLIGSPSRLRGRFNTELETLRFKHTELQAEIAVRVYVFVYELPLHVCFVAVSDWIDCVRCVLAGLNPQTCANLLATPHSRIIVYRWSTFLR